MSAPAFPRRKRATPGREQNGVTDGDRTRDNRNHNPALYQLSYGHRAKTAGILPQEGGKSKASTNPDPNQCVTDVFGVSIRYPPASRVSQLNCCCQPGIASNGLRYIGSRWSNGLSALSCQ